MSRLPIYCVNLFYLPYILLLTLLCLLVVFPLFLAGFFLLRKGRWDDAMRCAIWAYGRTVVTLSWPLVRTRRTGAENIPRGSSCVLVCNHRSYLDIMFSSLLPVANVVVAARAWPLGLFLVRWFTRHARYIDIESRPLEEILEESRRIVARNIPFLFFPEGHRSRDGRLQRFRSGALRVAVENDLPVVPVLLTGTERTAPVGRFLPDFTATVCMEILPPVHPSSFPAEKRALKLRRRVESIFREHLGEEGPRAV